MPWICPSVVGRSPHRDGLCTAIAVVVVWAGVEVSEAHDVNALVAEVVSVVLLLAMLPLRGPALAVTTPAAAASCLISEGVGSLSCRCSQCVRIRFQYGMYVLRVP